MFRPLNRLRAASSTALFVLFLACLPHGPAWCADATAATAVTATAATDRATFFSNAQFQSIWQDLEKRQVINQRVVEGGRYSINVRIVKPTDAPLVHAGSADVWVVTAGSATAVTGGKLLNPVQRPNGDDIAGTAIEGGSEKPVATGDMVFVPPGVPHGFRNLKHFRAFLIRFDTK